MLPHQQKRPAPTPGLPPEDREGDAHILVCFLTLAMWRVLEMWMKSKGLGNCARQLIKEIATVRMMDVVLPVRDQRELNLRVVSKPDEQVAQLTRTPRAGTAHCTKNDFKCSGEKSIIRKAIVSKQAPSRRFKPHNCRTWAKVKATHEKEIKIHIRFKNQGSAG